MVKTLKCTPLGNAAARLAVALLAICPLLVGGCICQRPSPQVSLANSYKLDAELSRAVFADFTREPHPFGSSRQSEIANALMDRLSSLGIKTFDETFISDTPNAFGKTPPVVQTHGKNIYAKVGNLENTDCTVVFASHYDTKNIEGIRYVGANDSGSSSVLLVDMARFLMHAKPSTNCNFTFLWLDGEESVLPDWNDGLTRHPARIVDHTYGSRFAASSLQPCSQANKKTHCWPLQKGGEAVVSFILLDMIGSPGLVLTQDSNSDPSLLRLAQKSAEKLGLANTFGETKQPIEDDHIPFLKAGVPAVDLIDFHHLSTWHQDGDNFDRVSSESLESVGKVALLMGLSIASQPKVFLHDADPTNAD